MEVLELSARDGWLLDTMISKLNNLELAINLAKRGSLPGLRICHCFKWRETTDGELAVATNIRVTKERKMMEEQERKMEELTRQKEQERKIEEMRVEHERRMTEILQALNARLPTTDAPPPLLTSS